ncbi:tripartite tricarboxylate transporter TctB family protein [Brevibacterium aurantiacum]|uniref:Tripartite tricarboxylate transporter TctB family protein n=1 Tax=Brevibacterium aurantiacum TaxID=273384 RepID=A0A556C402_BREAU|nr:tripartite tricarboxylate transporter TctB family protein [Brevibacterium aurantiacum]TSI12199.1 tripartite tricarboxylate transporter TctB family protein [Brevibacterium aurantiacum]
MRTLTPALRGDVITGIAVTLVGAVYYIATFWIQETKNIVTPATFPAIVGIALIVLGLFLVGQALYRSRKLAEVVPSGTTSAGRASASGGAGADASEGVVGVESAGVVLDAPEEPKSKQVVLQFALFFIYLGILIPVGFLLSTAAFLMTMTSIYAPHRWVRNLIFSVLFSVIIYVAFVYGLAVYLPVGILG